MALSLPGSRNSYNAEKLGTKELLLTCGRVKNKAKTQELPPRIMTDASRIFLLFHDIDQNMKLIMDNKENATSAIVNLFRNVVS